MPGPAIPADSDSWTADAAFLFWPLFRFDHDTGQFMPDVRFTLMDRDDRQVEAERIGYSGSVEDWADIEWDEPFD